MALALPVFVALSSCVLSKALYLGRDVRSPVTGPQSADTGGAGDINGVFPEAVYIKTRTQTFNSCHYYLLHDGLIWHKSIDGQKGPADWTLFAGTGLPHDSWNPGFHRPERIAEIAADADELVALSDEGGFYRYCLDITMGRKSNVWLDRQGWPDEEQLFLDRRTAKNLSWALGKRNARILYYEDPFGNQHHNGTMEIATTYVLLEDGQEICYADTGLPGDFSRNYIGPERGAFKAVALSASGSTMFVINAAGEMYTRLADFDTTGCDPLWFKYTYVPYTSNLPGTNYFSNLNEWGLPGEDWRPQPPIPLAGNAAITRHITILQNGQGNGARELRVAGLNEAGETGYWTKAIFAGAWDFTPVPLYFERDAVLKGPNSPEGGAGRGPSPDKSYGGYCWNGGEREDGWEYTIPNFNILEGDCDLRITRRGETCTLKLYPVEMWSYLKRDYLPGRTGSPKILLVTLAIPDGAFDGLSPEFAAELARKYAGHDRKLFQYTMAASRRYLFMREAGGADSVLFLTDGTEEPSAEFRQARLVEDFEEIARYYSPELVIDPRAAVTRGEVTGKIELNRALRDGLKYRIRHLKWSQLTTFKINSGYLPAHYTALITGLYLVDLPKIRTVTRFGDRIVLTNSRYVYTVSGLRIRVYEKIIGLLETRLRCYGDLAKKFAGAGPDTVMEAALPPWYSENITGYWDGAGLPRVIPGAFFGPGLSQTQAEQPAVLSFVPPEVEPELFGWYFSIGEPGLPPGEDKGFSIFIDPLKSPGTVYSRKGRGPGEKTVRLDCMLYVNPGKNPPFGQEVIDRMLEPFIVGRGGGMKVRITFDGHTFEIRRYPASPGASLVFRGEL
jgi:hypothetical protein